MNVSTGGSPVEVLPCPCCGSNDLHIGGTAALRFGVICQRCGLRMEREVANRRTKRTLRELEIWTLRQAIDAWNCRMGGIVNEHKKQKVKLWIEVEAGERCMVAFDFLRTPEGETLEDVVVLACKTADGRAFCQDGVTRSVHGGLGVEVF